MKDVDKYIYDFVRSEEFKTLLGHDVSTTWPVTMTYAIERLIITHVKLFMMEDQVRDKNLSDEEVGKIKRKIDYWNGVVRPRLIGALGEMMADAVLNKDPDIIKEPNLKDYKAR